MESGFGIFGCWVFVLFDFQFLVVGILAFLNWVFFLFFTFDVLLMDFDFLILDVGFCIWDFGLYILDFGF